MHHAKMAGVIPPLARAKGKAKRKAAIPKALQEQVWLKTMGRAFEGKCPVQWCTNTLTVFDFQCGHNVPESKGGKTTLENLIPLCGRCNLSMGNRYTIDEWNRQFSSPPPPPPTWRRYLCYSSKLGTEALSGRVPASR